MKKGILYTILLYLALSLASCSATKFCTGWLLSIG